MLHYDVITSVEYDAIKARLLVHDAWVDTLRKKTKCG